jgi:excisionase family DNA binding protein
METLYTLHEVAELLGAAYITIYRWVVSGKLKSIKVGGQYRVRQSDLDEFVFHRGE